MRSRAYDAAASIVDRAGAGCRSRDRAGSVTPWTSARGGRAARRRRARDRRARRRRGRRRRRAGARRRRTPLRARGRPTTSRRSASISPRDPGRHRARRRPRQQARADEPHRRRRRSCSATTASRTSGSARAGVYENLRSPATYLNRTRAGTTPVPDDREGHRRVDPAALASHLGLAHRDAGTTTASTGWARRRPPRCSDDPGAFHTIDPQWTVVFRYGAQTVVVHGRLDWVPGPERVAVGAARRGAVRARFRRRALASRRGARSRRSSCSSASTSRTRSAPKSARAGRSSAKTLQFFGDNFVSVIVWVARRRSRSGRSGAGGVEALYGVLLVGRDGRAGERAHRPLVPVEVAAARRSVPTCSRAREVAIALGLGLGLAVGALLALRAFGAASRRARMRAIRAGSSGSSPVSTTTRSRVECSRLDAAEVSRSR